MFSRGFGGTPSLRDVLWDDTPGLLENKNLLHNIWLIVDFY